MRYPGRLLQGALALGGAVLAAPALWPGVMSLQVREAFVLVLFAAALTAFGTLHVAFVNGPNRHHATADTALAVLACLLLAAPQAALVAGIAGIWRRRTLPLAQRMLDAGHRALVVGSAAALLQQATPHGQVAPAQVILVAALACAALLAVITLGLTLLEDALAADRSAHGTLRSTPVALILAAGTVVPAIVLGMAAPYMQRWWLALAIVSAGQALGWVVLRLLRSEYDHRLDNTYLRSAVSAYTPAASDVFDKRVLAAGGEQREITVLFCDIRGFTSWSEKQDPQSVFRELNRLLSELTQSVLSTGGTLDKYTGDGLMAFWGAPRPQDDQAERAYRAALSMFERLAAFNDTRRNSGHSAFNIGIGITTGTALVGNVGHEQRLDYTAIGDTVNLAARLEGATPEVGVPLLIAEATFLKLPYEMQRTCARLHSISVKGRSEAIMVYTLQRFAGRRPAA